MTFRPQSSEVKGQKPPGLALASVAQLVEASSSKPKGLRFDSWSGHIPGLRVWSPVGVCMRGNQSMLLSLPPSLPTSLLLSLKPISISSGEDKKQITRPGGRGPFGGNWRSAFNWYCHRLCDWDRSFNYPEPQFPHPLHKANSTCLPASQGACVNPDSGEWEIRILNNLKERRWWKGWWWNTSAIHFIVFEVRSLLFEAGQHRNTFVFCVRMCKSF